MTETISSLDGALVPWLTVDDGVRSMASDRPSTAQLLNETEQSPVPGRSAADDLRFAVHEASHALVQPLKNGRRVGGVTVQPTEFAAAMRWSPKFEAANLRDDDDVQDQEFVAAILSTLPAVGEPAASDIYALTHARVCELTAGSQGEALFLEGPPLFARSDEASARANASLICSSVEAVEKFVDFCRAEAASVLAQHEHVVRAISAQLRIRRTLNGAEVDQIIERAVAAKVLADAVKQRADWRSVVASSAKFAAQELASS